MFFSVLSQRENPNYAYLTHQINIQNPDENLIVARPDRAQSHKAFLINASRREWEGEGQERGIFLFSDQQEMIIWKTRVDLPICLSPTCYTFIVSFCNKNKILARHIWMTLGTEIFFMKA